MDNASMNPVHTVRMAAVPPEPWRNGGGTTRTLLAWPDAARWRLRVSVAAITQDGAFSAFAGVQRWLAVLQGAGVVLALPGGPVQLDGQSPALCFDGAAAPGCRLVNGATEDLNFMVQGGGGWMQRARSAPGTRDVSVAHDAGNGRTRTTDVTGSTAWRALYAADAATLAVDGQMHALAPGTLCWTDAAGPSRWQLAAPCPRAWWLTLPVR